MFINYLHRLSVRPRMATNLISIGIFGQLYQKYSLKDWIIKNLANFSIKQILSLDQFFINQLISHLICRLLHKIQSDSFIKNFVNASITVISQIIHMHVSSNFFHQKRIFWFSSNLLDSQDYRDVWGNLFYLRYPVFDIIHSIFKRSFTDDYNVLEKKQKTPMIITDQFSACKKSTILWN